MYGNLILAQFKKKGEMMRIKFQEFKKLLGVRAEENWTCTQNSKIIGKSYCPPDCPPDYHSPAKTVYYIGATVDYVFWPLSITYEGDYTCSVYHNYDDRDNHGYDDDDYEDHFIPVRWDDDDGAHGPWHSDLEIVCDNDDIVSVNTGTWLSDSDPCDPISKEVEEYLEDYFTDLNTSDAMNEIREIEKKQRELNSAYIFYYVVKKATG